MHAFSKTVLGTVCGLALLAAGSTRAQEQTAKVFEFDGWQVTIAPGQSTPAAKTPAAAPIRAGSVIRPASFLQDVNEIPVEPTPVPESAPTNAAPRTPTAPRDPVLLAQQYKAIYESIPFLRSQMHDNPSYRHDAAMEILFGQMRPTIIQRSKVEMTRTGPATQYIPSPYSKYGMNSFFYPFYWP